MSTTAELVHGEQPMSWRKRLKVLTFVGGVALTLVLSINFLNLLSMFVMPMAHTVSTSYTTNAQSVSAEALRRRIENEYPRTKTSITTIVKDAENLRCGQGFSTVALLYRANIFRAREINAGFHRIANDSGYRACSGLRVQWAPPGASPFGQVAGGAILGCGLLLMFVLARTRLRWREKWMDWSPCMDVPTAVRWGALGAIVTIAAVSLMESIGTAAGLETGGAAMRTMGRDAILATLPLAVLGAPVAQEYIFRAWLLERTARVAPPALALLLSSVAFAAIHMPQNMLQGAEILVAGIGLGLIWLRTRSLVAVVVAHGLYNAGLLALQWVAAG